VITKGQARKFSRSIRAGLASVNSLDYQASWQVAPGWDLSNRGEVTPPIRSTEQPGPCVVQVVKKQKGGSQSRLVLCDDGKLYVLKMHPNPQGNNVLANEALGAILLSALGFLVPPWRPITINLKTLPFFPELKMETADGTKLPACGTHFGSEYLGGPQYPLFDLIPESYQIRNDEQVAAMHLFDLWANHHDHRQCVYRQIKKNEPYEAVFIDNRHLFGGPSWSHDCERSVRLWSHFIQQRGGTDSSIMEWYLTLFKTRIPQLLLDAVAVVPPEWYKGDIYALCARLLQRLECLRGIASLEPVRRTS
jgi:hypothetical protein